MSRGILHGNGCAIEFYTSQPSAAQWIALGVVPLPSDIDVEDPTHRVLVGTGDSEQAAIASLRARLDDLFSVELALLSGAAAHVAAEPSDWFG
jgi:hypothetical protein